MLGGSSLDCSIRLGNPLVPIMMLEADCVSARELQIKHGTCIEISSAVFDTLSRWIKRASLKSWMESWHCLGVFGQTPVVLECPHRWKVRRYVASGPLVRSSYRAGEFFIESMIDSDKAAAS